MTRIERETFDLRCQMVLVTTAQKHLIKIIKFISFCIFIDLKDKKQNSWKILSTIKTIKYFFCILLKENWFTFLLRPNFNRYSFLELVEEHCTLLLIVFTMLRNFHELYFLSSVNNFFFYFRNLHLFLFF